jgi:hypothetical protein
MHTVCAVRGFVIIVRNRSPTNQLQIEKGLRMSIFQALSQGPVPKRSNGVPWQSDEPSVRIRPGPNPTLKISAFHKKFKLSYRFLLTILEPLKHNRDMNKLSNIKRAQIVSSLVEGNSLRATARICDVAFNTVLARHVRTIRTSICGICLA